LLSLLKSDSRFNVSSENNNSSFRKIIVNGGVFILQSFLYLGYLDCCIAFGKIHKIFCVNNSNYFYVKLYEGTKNDHYCSYELKCQIEELLVSLEDVKHCRGLFCVKNYDDKDSNKIFISDFLIEDIYQCFQMTVSKIDPPEVKSSTVQNNGSLLDETPVSAEQTDVSLAGTSIQMIGSLSVTPSDLVMNPEHSSIVSFRFHVLKKFGTRMN